MKTTFAPSAFTSSVLAAPTTFQLAIGGLKEINSRAIYTQGDAFIVAPDTTTHGINFVQGSGTLKIANGVSGESLTLFISET